MLLLVKRRAPACIRGWRPRGIYNFAPQSAMEAERPAGKGVRRALQTPVRRAGWDTLLKLLSERSLVVWSEAGWCVVTLTLVKLGRKGRGEEA